MSLRWQLTLGLLMALAQPATGQIIVPGADGSDGAFNPGANTTVLLWQSPTGTWDGPNPDPGTPLTGVYDPEKWAVVFRFSSVNIPSGVTVSFNINGAHAPVVWLVNGNVTINGTVDVSGYGGLCCGQIQWPGPGGFRGGRGNQSPSSPQSGGFGPGGTRNLAGGSASYGGSYGSPGNPGNGPNSAGPTYGSASIIPLIGGSGGTGQLQWSGAPWVQGGGGSGGGAILIAATGTITINGIVRANGGAGNDGSGGSGGAIRLVGNDLQGGGQVRAIGGSAGGAGGAGGQGRIRLEAAISISPFSTDPGASQEIIGTTAQIWPSETAPSVTIVSIGGFAAPEDPHPNLSLPSAMQLSNPFPSSVVIEAANMPLDWTVRVRTVPASGQDILTTATYVSGDATLSTWEAQVQLSNGFSVMQARAVAP